MSVMKEFFAQPIEKPKEDRTNRFFPPPKKHHDSKEPEKVPILIPKEDWQSFKEFVGYLDENGEIHRGEAIPEPVDVDTGEYKGILWYQEEGFEIIETHDNILILWPRGHGKTWLLAWYIEWNMKHSIYKAMYLSITDVINDVADWVFDWADINDVLAEGDKVERTIRRNTPKSFKLLNGSKFKIYSVTDKKMRGKHDYVIFMDDVIEEGSLTHPTFQRGLERRWNSTISKMRRNKLVIVNTRVYEGDFIEYLIKQFKTKEEIMLKKKPEDVGKWQLFIDLKTPFLYAKDAEKRCKNEFEIDDEGYAIDPENGERLLIAPELYTAEHFEAMEAADYESFMAEMMQNPTSIKGGMVDPDDIKYVKRPFFADGVQMVGIGVDLSWADDSPTADMSAIISMTMHGKIKTRTKKFVKRFTVVREDVDRIPLYNTIKQGKEVKGVFTLIGEHYKFLKKQYPNIPIIIAIERNGGGTVIINVAQREKFKWIRRVISDKKTAIKWSKEGKVNVQLGIHHSKNKIARIFGELRKSIQSHEMRFDWMCEDSVLIAQLLAFPKGRHDDGPDAMGMIKDELNRRWHPKKIQTRHMSNEERIKRAKAEKRFQEMSEPWRKDQERASREQKRQLMIQRRKTF